MTFKPEISRVTIFNEALALLPSDPVQDPDETSIEARECRRFYKSVVANLLERHHWNLATTRGDLAAITNDRENEWGYAYAKPTDMAFPVSARDANGMMYRGWLADGYRYLIGGRPAFMQVRGTLYSMIETANLEYTTFDITEADFSTIFKDIVVLELASRICYPITKDGGHAKELATRAEVERSRAIAIDLNRNQPTYGDKPLETELTRGVGLGSGTFTGNYPLDPVAHPSNVG
jgi:hypothetical protein